MRFLVMIIMKKILFETCFAEVSLRIRTLNRNVGKISFLWSCLQREPFIISSWSNWEVSTFTIVLRWRFHIIVYTLYLTTLTESNNNLNKRKFSSYVQSPVACIGARLTVLVTLHHSLNSPLVMLPSLILRGSYYMVLEQQKYQGMYDEW